MITFSIIITFLFIFALLSIKIVPQSQVYLVEQFGKYIKTLNAGLNIIIPIVNTVTQKISILERQLPANKISIITKDNVEIHLTTTVFYRVIDAAKSYYRISNVDQAVQTTVTSIVRSTCGQLEFDEVQSRREFISEKIQTSLSEACSIWGIEITRTEILDVVVDDATRNAMQQQLNAERERRATVTRAEGDRQSQQLMADAELYTAQKQAEAKRVLAEADAFATITVGKAMAENGKIAAEFEILKKQIDGLSEISKSNNSKLIILPTDITKVIGTVSALLDLVKK